MMPALPAHLADDPSPVEHRPVSVRGPVILRTLSSFDLPAFRALRLDALRLHPETFVPTHEEEQASDPRALAQRFRNDWIHDGSFILGAYRGDRLVGAIGVRRSPRRKHGHKATIWLLYTQAVVRGQGIGRMLLEEAIARCWREPELEVLQLTVGSESDAAYRLYTRVGFQVYGIERHAMKLDERYIDVTLMALRLVPKGY